MNNSLITLIAPFLKFKVGDNIQLNENRLKGLCLVYFSTNDEVNHFFVIDEKYKDIMHNEFESFSSDLEGEWFLNPYNVSFYINQEMFCI